MAILSNFNWRRDLPPEDRGGKGALPFTCRPAQKDELTSGLRLILAPGAKPADDEAVLDFLRFGVERGIDLNRMWVARRDAGATQPAGPVLWAILPVLSPGRTMLLLSPTTSPTSSREAAARSLVQKVIEQYATLDVHLGQVLLDPEEKSAQRLYAACGFRQLAELLYLQRLIRGTDTQCPEPAPQGMEWQTYGPDTHALFARAIASTYENSLDCPALNGLRDIDDVIAGHKATGEHDPRLWVSLVQQGRPQGVLLLSKTPRTDSLELVYLGLAPESRGRGIGDLLMRRAITSAADRELSRLTLAVDSRNAPALKLYYRHGMHRITSRLALLRDLRA
ncbi:MAG: GNAT family N-acetyltransferase [Tepidisphaeraceae bacterium]